MSNQENNAVSREKRFLFDLQGFLVLRNILSQTEYAEYLEVLRHLAPKITRTSGRNLLGLADLPVKPVVSTKLGLTGYHVWTVSLIN